MGRGQRPAAQASGADQNVMGVGGGDRAAASLHFEGQVTELHTGRPGTHVCQLPLDTWAPLNFATSRMQRIRRGGVGSSGTSCAP